ncbi:MAG: DNA polymerase III subunit beta [Candidatus Wildermuthbacteria bacterium RIFCSPHIGHO2_02_FULL_47_12]|uniref:Beta sliding clamp n=1 Tax=Candidatus Wildermuthbacteria bacterium RIFCSPHIGHO2_02_FULL_47_12 TaxID=1802451 RepID=A0A1G2R5F3_9BACT|nr:MAG: DNA polymerase III subunit beta [Candidatus Wildermuthbacteria bacterium RIFCSPHIGHO2_02_FULL_47_12]
MKTTILKDSLRAGLSVVERVAAKSPSLPILGNILVSAAKNAVELAATDLEIGVRYKILAKNEKEGSCVLPARSLSQFVALLPENQITLTAKESGLAIDAKDQQTLLKTLPAEDFPIIPTFKEGDPFVEVETHQFFEGMGQVASMAGQTQARPEISGVFVSFSSATCKLAATDSFRLAEQTLVFSKGQTLQTTFILPAKTARELVAVLGEQQGKTRIYVSASQAVFDYVPEQPGKPSIQIISRLIEGEYPQYQDIIPKDFSAKLVVDKNAFITQLKVASIFSGKLNDVKLIADQKKKGVELVSKSSDVGEHVSFIPAQVQGENIETSFNWRFLLDGVMHMKEDEIELGLSGPESPALLKSVRKEGYLYVLMPLKV